MTELKFKFAALYSKEYGHIANAIDIKDHPRHLHCPYCLTTVPKEAREYQALNFVNAIYNYLVDILKSDEAVNNTQEITDFLSSLSEFNDDFPEMDVLEDIERILVINGMRNGEPEIYYYSNTPGGFKYRPANLYEVGVNLHSFIQSYDFIEEYDEAINQIYQIVEETYNTQNDLNQLREYNENIPAIFPNSNLSRDVTYKVTEIGKPKNSTVSKKGKGVRESYYLEIDRRIEGMNDDLTETLDHIEKQGYCLTPLGRMLYASICGFADSGYTRIRLTDLARHCYQRSNDAIKKMPKEYLEEIYNEINRLTYIKIYVYLDNVTEKYRLDPNDLKTYGIEKTPNGEILQGYLIPGEWHLPLDGDISKVYLELLRMPVLANHDRIIKQIQHIPPGILKTRGLLKSEKVSMAGELERVISNQRSMLKNSKDKITKKDLHKPEYARLTTVNINNLLVRSGIAEWDPTNKNEIIFPSVTAKQQRKKRSKEIKDVIKAFSDYAYNGIIEEFEVIRRDGGKEIYYLGSGEERSTGKKKAKVPTIKSRASSDFKPNKQIEKISFFCNQDWIKNEIPPIQNRIKS